MPVYLFTLHAYGSWMPDHRRGYTHRGDGIRPKDKDMANRYLSRMPSDAVSFNHKAQAVIAKALREKCTLKGWRLYAVATDETHIHTLLGWTEFTPWEDVRRGLKSSLTRQLNQEITRQTWFSKSGSRKRVTDPKHFNHLMQTYLPSHRGVSFFDPPQVDQHGEASPRC